MFESPLTNRFPLEAGRVQVETRMFKRVRLTTVIVMRLLLVWQSNAVIQLMTLLFGQSRAISAD